VEPPSHFVQRRISARIPVIARCACRALASVRALPADIVAGDLRQRFQPAPCAKRTAQEARSPDEESSKHHGDREKSETDHHNRKGRFIFQNPHETPMHVHLAKLNQLPLQPQHAPVKHDGKRKQRW